METTQFNQILKDNNANGYLVGGAVRDKLAGLAPKDNDYCVTGLDQSTFESLFPAALLQGKDFPVYRMELDGEQCEVALARAERKVGVGHKGFEIDASPSVTIEDDLSRRDLTINSMAECLDTGELIDPFYGEIDLKNAMLRATTEAFVEDPLRVYRTARFSAKFGFFVEYSTLMTMKSLKDELSSLSIERVMEETKKALLTDKPSNFFRHLYSAGVLDVHFPELAVLADLEQNRRYHPEGNVFEHTMQVLDATRSLINFITVKDKFAVMFSALLHDVGKKPTFALHPVHNTPTYHSHEKEGVPIAEEFLNRFKLTSMKNTVLFNVANHMVMHEAFTKMKASKAVDFMDGKFEYSGESYVRKPGVLNTMDPNEYLVVCLADSIGRLGNAEHLPRVVNALLLMLMTRPGSIRHETVLHNLSSIIEDDEEAENLAKDFVILINHSHIFTGYVNVAKGIGCKQDIQELKKSFQGEALGHAIHKDKKAQRLEIMKTARNFFPTSVEA